MIEKKKTHRLVKNPAMSAKELADYMVASEVAKRTIVRDCKFRPIARVMQHREAKLAVSKFIRAGRADVAPLQQAAESLRTRMADTDFDRDLFDHNADYIERFAQIQGALELPDADILPPGTAMPLVAHDVRINPDIQFRMRRVTRTNKIRIGAGAFRYSKGRAANVEASLWHSAFLFGYLDGDGEEMAEPDQKLCLTIDAYSGVAHSAPGDAVRRYANMLAACASISERWPNIPEPPNCVL